MSTVCELFHVLIDMGKKSHTTKIWKSRDLFHGKSKNKVPKST